MNTIAAQPRPPAAPESVGSTEAYVRPFARLERDTTAASRGPSWLFPLRKAGIARFAERGLPGLSDEDWRFTNLEPLRALPFLPALEVPSRRLTLSELAGAPFLDTLTGDRLVFVDGHFDPTLSRLGAVSGGVVVTNLAAGLGSHAALLEKHLTRYTRSEVSALTALNDAYFTDGALIEVPAGRSVEQPIHLVFVATGTEPGLAIHARNLILVGNGATATVLEHYLGIGDAAAITNTVTELAVGDQAHLEHLRFQDERRSAFHLGTVHGAFGRTANASLHSFALGGRLSRQNIRVALEGEGLEVVLNGLYLTEGEQLADHHMIVDHAQPHCASHEYFNGILEGRSRGVFHGRILVRKGAQKTDAKQTNKNLLLSDDATANTKPQLEIYADDVKCTHGATIGQLHPEHIFYLRSRGISQDTARRMLIHAFAGEIIERVRHTALREVLDRVIWDRLEQDSLIQVGPHH